MLLPYAYVANKSTQSDYKQLRLIVDHWQFNYYIDVESKSDLTTI